MAEDDYPRSRSGAGADNDDVDDGGGGGGEGDTTLTAGARHGFLLGGVDGVNGAGGVEGEMTDLERLVLAEYERLRGNMRRVSSFFFLCSFCDEVLRVWGKRRGRGEARVGGRRTWWKWDAREGLFPSGAPHLASIGAVNCPSVASGL